MPGLSLLALFVCSLSRRVLCHLLALRFSISTFPGRDDPVDKEDWKTLATRTLTEGRDPSHSPFPEETEAQTISRSILPFVPRTPSQLREELDRLESARLLTNDSGLLKVIDYWIWECESQLETSKLSAGRAPSHRNALGARAS